MLLVEAARIRRMLDASRMDDAIRRGPEVETLITEFRAIETRRKELQGDLDGLRAKRNAANARMSKLDKSSSEFAEARGTERLRFAL